MQNQPRRLVLMRHSKAEQSGPSDRERELSDRGRADGAATGAWLASELGVPDLVLVSDAARTRGTWEAVAEGAGWDVQARFEDDLYNGGPDAALDLVREVDPATGSVLVIGHNPTIAYLAELLEDGDGDPDAADRMADGYPTSAAAVLEVPPPWAELDAAAARLVGFHVGRG